MSLTNAEPTETRIPPSPAATTSSPRCVLDSDTGDDVPGGCGELPLASSTTRVAGSGAGQVRALVCLLCFIGVLRSFHEIDDLEHW